jgi:hypothetical protein
LHYTVENRINWAFLSCWNRGFCTYTVEAGNQLAGPERPELRLAAGFHRRFVQNTAYFRRF